MPCVVTSSHSTAAQSPEQHADLQRIAFKKSVLLSWMKNCVLETSGLIPSCEQNVKKVKLKTTVGMGLFSLLNVKILKYFCNFHFTHYRMHGKTKGTISSRQKQRCKQSFVFVYQTACKQTSLLQQCRFRFSVLRCSFK